MLSTFILGTALQPIRPDCTRFFPPDTRCGSILIRVVSGWSSCRCSGSQRHIPPLRDRHKDLPLLIEHFLRQFGKDAPHRDLPGHVLQMLYHHDWPGNIRELQNVLQRYLTVNRLEFPGSRRPEQSSPHENCAHPEIAAATQQLQEAVEAFEKQFLLKALEQHRWNKVQTAKALGIGRKTLYRKMKQFDLM